MVVAEVGRNVGARELAADVPEQVSRALAPAAPPATGAWREGDPVGHRRFADVGDLPLQLGGVLPQVRLAYETWGTLARTGPTPSSSSTP